MNELLYYDLKNVSGLTPGLATQVCREIGRRIVAGLFPEGQFIDDEIKLSKRYNVSKSVVREAVKILVAKGLLEVRRGNGTRVRQRASWNLLDDDVLAWHQGVEPETDFLRKLIDVRLMVEPNAAFWAAGAATNEQIKEISKSHNDMENAKSIQEFVVADAKFHRAVLRGANNELLTAMERSLPLHYKILKAIETQNKERAEFAMRKHMADTYERLSKLLPELKSGVKKM
jgi:DNA-binding FadR family transcriptional regulator